MMEGMKVIGVYVWHEKYTCSATGDVIRKGPKVGQGQIVILTHLSAVDYTRGNKAILVGMEDEKGDDHYYQKDDDAGVFDCHLDGQIILLPGEKPLGAVLSASTSDVLYFSAHGLIYKYPEAR